MQQWVCGFLFSPTHHELNVALIAKLRGPEFLVGKLNGIGGKIEPGETAFDAMVREFNEEAGVVIPTWRHFCTLNVRSCGRVFMYEATATPTQARAVHSVEEEQITWIDVRKMPYYNIVPNLRWLVPMALDKDNVIATVEDPT